jgi:hypothetical protein
VTKLDASIVNELAKDCGFMQRTRKITAYNLIESVLFSKFETDKLSLNDHSLYLLIHKGIIVKKQSIDERFNAKAVRFIKRLIELTLSEELAKTKGFPLLDIFPKVRLKDAVNFQLPEHLKQDYPGSGGAASKAMLKIQFEYDFISRKILELEVCPFIKTDTINASETMQNIDFGELVIRDLGYVSIENIRTLSEQRGAYYLNRLNTTTNAFYEKNGQRIDFTKIETWMRKQGLERYEIKVKIGTKKKLLTRMIITLVPEVIKEKRIRDRRKYAIKKKHTISKEAIARCGLNIFITNAEKDLIPLNVVGLIYGIRWQIENIFKVWKSIGGIQKVKKMSKERFEFYLYSKLLLLLKAWQSLQIIEQITNQTISYYKYLKGLSNVGWENFDKIVERLLRSVGVEKFIQKENRKNRINEFSLKTALNACLLDY